MHGYCAIWNEEHTHPIQRRYFVYQGATKGKEILDEDATLAIGAYKSAFLADIMASYVFEETEECFVK
eukprot:246706-Ditylum_brightwellii.AAC.1